MTGIQLPIHPFLMQDPRVIDALRSPQMMQDQRPPMGLPPMPNAPRRPDFDFAVGPANAPVATPSQLPTMLAAPPAVGPQGGSLGSRLKNFANSDAALALAAGVLEGGTTGQALGRGFGYALQARQPKKEDFPTSYREWTLAGKPGTYGKWVMNRQKAGATSIELSDNSEVFAGMPKDIRDVLFERQAKAQDAADIIEITNEGKALLDRGAITGAGAGIRIAAIKWAGTLGLSIPQDAANNSEVFKSVMGQAVGKIIKQFGAGTGLSDADREYAEKIVGGSVELNEAAIRRIFDIAERAARGEISEFSTMRDKVLSGDITGLMNVATPPPYQAPTATGPNGQKLILQNGQWVPYAQ